MVPELDSYLAVEVELFAQVQDTDGVGIGFGEPERFARTTDNAGQGVIGSSGDGEFADAAAGGDAGDLAGGAFNEPEIAIGPGGEPERIAVSGWNSVFSDILGLDVYLANLISKNFSEPDIAIRSGSDADGMGTRTGGQSIFGHDG